MNCSDDSKEGLMQKDGKIYDAVVTFKVITNTGIRK